MTTQRTQIQFRDVTIEAKLADRALDRLNESPSTLAKTYLGQHFILLEVGMRELKEIFSGAELREVVQLDYEPSWFPAEFIPQKKTKYAVSLANLTAIQKFALADLMRVQERRAEVQVQAS